MSTVSFELETPVWEAFERAAKKRRRDPARLLREYVQECVEIWEDQTLDQDMRAAASRSQFVEEGAVEIVRNVRLGERVPDARA